MAKLVGFNIKKRRSFRKRRFTKKYRGTKMNKKGQKVHFFKRVSVTEIAISNNGFVAGSLANAYLLNQVPGYTEFTAMFDQYKICAIRNKFIFNRNSADVAGTGTELPMLITVNDFNDGTELTSEAVALEYDSYKASRLGTDKIPKRYFKPKVEGYTNEVKRRWVDCADVTITHRGLKMAVDTIGTANDKTLGTLKIYTTWYLAFKGAK